MGKQVDMRKRKDWRQWGHGMTEPEKPEKMQKMQKMQIWYGLMWVEMGWELRISHGGGTPAERNLLQPGSLPAADRFTQLKRQLSRLATSSATDLNVQCSAWCCLLRLVDDAAKKNCLTSAMSVISWVRMVSVWWLWFPTTRLWHRFIGCVLQSILERIKQHQTLHSYALCQTCIIFFL